MNDTTLDDKKSLSLDKDMSFFATELIKDKEQLLRFTNKSCAFINGDLVDNCVGSIEDYIKRCSENPYDCTLINAVPLIVYSSSITTNTFDAVELTAAISLYKEIPRRRGFFNRKRITNILIRIITLGMYNNSYDDQTLINSLTHKLKSGIYYKHYSPGNEQFAFSQLQLLFIGVESLTSSFIIFYRMLTLSIFDSFYSKFGISSPIISNKGFRLYVSYFKHMKKIGRTLVSVSKSLFKDADFFTVSGVIKEVYISLPNYISILSPSLDEQQSKMFTALFASTIHNAAIEVSEIVPKLIVLDSSTQNAIDSICKNTSGEKLSLFLCLRGRRTRNDLKKNTSPFEYTLIKAISKAEERQSRHQGKRRAFRDIGKNALSGIVGFFRNPLGKREQ